MARKYQCSCCGAIRIVNKTSGFIGVDFHKKSKKYRARITNNLGKTYHLGYFKSEHDASITYDDFIINNKLENKPLNHPERRI